MHLQTSFLADEDTKCAEYLYNQISSTSNTWKWDCSCLNWVETFVLYGNFCPLIIFYLYLCCYYYFYFFRQSAYLSSTLPVLVQAVLDFCDTNLPERVNIADLGCSSGPNTLFAVTELTSIIYKRCSQLGRSAPEFCVFLNDLPGNDFNTVFKSFPAFQEKMRAKNGPDFGPCYISGVPGSFYGRLFPSNSLHFVHSASSLHWLSQVCL